IRDITYWDTTQSAFYPGALIRSVTNSAYYDLALFTGDPNWHTYFFFGGPGGAGTPSGQPNLSPYRPQGWSAPIVISKSRGQTTDSNPLYASDDLFLDWAIANNGAVATVGTVSVDLYLDGQLKNTWSGAYSASLEPGSYVSARDIVIGRVPAGTHAIKVVADPKNTIPESNEADNVLSITITIQPAANPCDPSVNPRCGVRIIVPEPRTPRH
ncbi:MAG TPA: CARDB domain-containing protein, partial [Thermoanaerobaculia bacterium]|nr:CARDB domain-containing protein [Thermoanaerobaculia bacterium]